MNKKTTKTIEPDGNNYKIRQKQFVFLQNPMKILNNKPIDPMATRRLKNNYYHSISGMSFSHKNGLQTGFESTLERDYIYVLEFDINVKFYEVQPITIEYLDYEGSPRKYTPDFLVVYEEEQVPIGLSKPMLIEVKYREDLWKNWKQYKPKFLSAVGYAKSKGWRFKIMTEIEIRTDYLRNAKFLLRYRHAECDAGMIETLLDTIRELRLSNPEELIKVATMDVKRRAELLHTLWYMVDSKMIGCDLNEPLTMKSEIWSMESMFKKQYDDEYYNI